MSSISGGNPGSASGHATVSPTPQPGGHNDWDPDERDIYHWEQLLAYDPTPENIENIKTLIAIYRHRILAYTCSDRPKTRSYHGPRLLLEGAFYLSQGEERQKQVRSVALQHAESSWRQEQGELERLQDRMGRLKEVMRFRYQPRLFRSKMLLLIIHLGLT